jgi:hypothetical protein
MSAPFSRAGIIAAQNDAFRKRFPLLVHHDGQELLGRYVLTEGVAALPAPVRDAVLAAVRGFDRFEDANDPHGERDFGAIDHPGAQKVFWKIDYYDADYRYGSEDPADPGQTRRVLTIMLASKY